MNLKDTRQRINRLLEERHHLIRRIKEEKEALSVAQQYEADVLEAQRIFQEVAQGIQQTTHSKIADAVSKCLELVFDNPYEFEILFERKRGKTEAEIRFKKNGRVVNPKRGAGGSVVDVAAFALRLSCLSLQRPTLRHLLVMDEPFKYVEKVKRERLRLMLELLAKEMNFQFIMVTHDNELKAGKIIELK